jgi:TolB-like protein
VIRMLPPSSTQQSGDKIFLILAKSRKVPLAWDLNPQARLCVIAGLARGRGERSMASLATREIFLFEGFRLDRRGLFRRDERGVFVPIAIGARALDMFRVLIAARGELVSKDEIMAAVWPGIVVEDNNLTVQMSALRRILVQESAEGSCIQTVAGRGYRFVPTMTRRAADPDPDSAAVSSSGGGLPPPRLSIVVLPFTNLSDDRKQQYFADGITEDLTTDLSRIADMLVISRNTAFTYRNKPVDTKQIGRELGVRYVLEGSVRRSENQVRVNTQLIEAETNAHLWAERFDRDIGDLFAWHDEITSRIAIELSLELVGAEVARQADHPDALDYILRGRAAHSKPPTPDKYIDAISLFERALALDPRSVEAQSRLAIELTAGVLDQMSASTAAHILRAEGLVRQALEAAPRSPLAHYAKGQVLRAQRRYAEAIAEYETAITFDRNWVHALGPLAECKLFTGSIDETIPLVERAIRLSPRDPFIAIWYFRIGRVHLLQSRTDEAIVWLEKARGAHAELPYVHSDLASAYALRGETDRSAVELVEARRLSLDGRYSSILRLQATGYSGVPKIHALYEATYLAGLRKAGMPEE